ncbi:MAG TPA: 30S ribosome-binding factor RbfA [Candidatus Limnocylindria bacterium]|nr:30S ribosome-binding factor RbfA [Candidatus Limnocylindria bacterium]
MRIRPERVAQLMRRELAEILRDLRDPRLAEVVGVTDVEVTNDLSLAKVFVTVHESSVSTEKVLGALARATGFVRHALAPRLGLREMPEIRFLLDDSIDRGARVDELLRKLERGEPIPDQDDEAGS